jgi:hypothetical protein
MTTPLRGWARQDRDPEAILPGADGINKAIQQKMKYRALS